MRESSTDILETYKSFSSFLCGYKGNIWDEAQRVSLSDITSTVSVDGTSEKNARFILPQYFPAIMLGLTKK